MPSDLALRVVSHEDLGAAHFLLTLESGEQDIPPWKAGQFAMIGLGLPAGACDPLLRRPFSLFNIPDQGAGRPRRAQVFYKILGRGTSLLSDVRSGDTIRCLLPLGNGFVLPQAAGRRLLLVAGGIGSASLHPLGLQEIRDGRSPLLLYGCRTAADLAGVRPTQEAGVEVQVATDDGTAGRRGNASELLDAFLSQEGPRAKDRYTICACGPTPMMKATAAVARHHGVSCFVSLESPMACGFGVCVGCVVGVKENVAAPLSYRRICMDGPVFDASMVCW